MRGVLVYICYREMIKILMLDGSGVSRQGFGTQGWKLAKLQV